MCSSCRLAWINYFSHAPWKSQKAPYIHSVHTTQLCIKKSLHSIGKATVALCGLSNSHALPESVKRALYSVKRALCSFQRAIAAWFEIKSPCILTKEACVPSNEPCIQSKNHSAISKKPCIPLKGPIWHRLVLYQKSPTFHQNTSNCSTRNRCSESMCTSQKTQKSAIFWKTAQCSVEIYSIDVYIIYVHIYVYINIYEYMYIYIFMYIYICIVYS